MRTRTIQLVTALFISAALLSQAGPATSAESKRPSNVVVILTDDV